MKKIDFLIKLNVKKKLKIVEPSEEIKESYIEKSRNNLKSAEILLESGQIVDAVPMAYYSMYNILIALFSKVGVKCENHTASIMLLKELFESDNSKIIFAKRERVDKQYYIHFSLTKEDVESMIGIAREFNNEVYNLIDKITKLQIEEYRNKLLKMLEQKKTTKIKK